MIPPHLPAPYPGAYAAASSTVQAVTAHPRPTITDLNRPFVLTIGGTPGRPATAIATFEVPPRLRSAADTLTDSHIIQTFHKIATDLTQWQLTSSVNACGGRTLVFTHHARQMLPQAPVLSLFIGQGNALQALTIHLSGNTHFVRFAQKRPSPQDLQRRAPGWLAQASPGNDAATGKKRPLTPPPQPPAHRPWKGSMTGPVARSHAALQQQVQTAQVTSDAIDTAWPTLAWTGRP